MGLTFNGKDIKEINPEELRKVMRSLPYAEKKVIEALIQNDLLDRYEEMTGRALPDDYAKEYGRPSIKEVPYMSSENDGYPYLGGGHSPQCDGKKDYHGTCWCDWIGWYPYGQGKKY